MDQESHRAEDLTSLDTFGDGIPYGLLAALRRDEPVSPVVDRGGLRSWMITRYADVVAISRDTTTFSSVLDQPADRDHGRPGALGLPLINMDPPVHAQYRRMVSWRFSPRALAGLDELISGQATAAVARAVAAGPVDFATEVAARIPLAVIADLLGLPPEDHDRVLGWSNRLMGPEDPEYGQPESAAEAHGQALEYFCGLADQRRAGPGDDLISLVATSDAGGEPLSLDEVARFCVLLLIGGNETTRNTMAQSARLLSADTEGWSQLTADPSLGPAAVDELLRYSSALMQSRRVATRDVKVGGVDIAAGDGLALWYASANRDETVFDDPERFDVARPVNPHITFGGGGPHVCLGAHLARLEVGALVTALLEQVQAIEVLGPPVRLRSTMVNGIKHLPVRLEPRRR